MYVASCTDMPACTNLRFLVEIVRTEKYIGRAFCLDESFDTGENPRTSIGKLGKQSVVHGKILLEFMLSLSFRTVLLNPAIIKIVPKKLLCKSLPSFQNQYSVCTGEDRPWNHTIATKKILPRYVLKASI